MGCDIHGYVEIDKGGDDYEYWLPGADIGPLVGRSYDAFGCLFGVRNMAGFEPIAAQRGIPETASRQVRDEYESWGTDAHSATYISYAELQAVDWDEKAVDRDERYTVFDENGEMVHKSIPGRGSGWFDVIQENFDALARGEEIEGGDGRYSIKRVRQTRGDAISGAWEWLINDLMGLFADRFGEESVRVVVWFDN